MGIVVDIVLFMLAAATIAIIIKLVKDIWTW